MAARFGRATIDGVTLVAATPTTILQLVAAANHAIRLTKLKIGFHGIVNTNEPVLVELVRQTTAGTMTGLTPVKSDDSIADTLDTTAQHTATVEPTEGDILDQFPVHPQTGIVEPIEDIVIGAADRVGVRVTAPAGVDVDCTVCFEE